MIKKPYQCGNAVYQLAKLRILEFYYDFLNKYFCRFWVVLPGYWLVLSSDKWWLLDEIVRPERKQAYEADKKIWLAIDKFSKATPGLFKPEFVGTRDIWLTAKCYLVQNETLNKNKYSCKGVSKQNNDLRFQRYKDVLEVFLKQGLVN